MRRVTFIVPRALILIGGVLFSLLIGFLGYLAFGRAAVKKQESTPLDND